jgi:hypothetical protein
MDAEADNAALARFLHLILRIPRQGGQMADVNKCAHPACKCSVAKGGVYGDYCSEHCQEAKHITEIRCDCKHPGCS